ncbi:MAG: hypothetical protein LQ340_002757, partial [Diploschistes diacapsis]
MCDEVGESRCALAGSESGSKKTTLDLLSTLYDRPVPVRSGPKVGLVTFYSFKSFLYRTLHRPQSWPFFANVARDLLRGNGASFLDATSAGISDFDGVESGTAVLCTDAVPATNYSLASWTSYVQNMTALSFVAGDSRPLETMPCRHWYAVPNERWEGDFENVHLDAPVLVIGNTYDPATPLDSAKRLAAHMREENARLLEQRSYGHCSLSTVSTCTWNVTLGYLLERKLPEKATVCEVDDGGYGDYFPRRDGVEAESLRLYRLMQAAL